MESSNLLYIFIGISTLAYFLFSKIFKPSNNPPLPPGSMGWPIIGETLQLQRGNKSSNPDNFFITRRKKYNNNIFKTSMIGSKTIMLCGAAGNKFLFTNEKSLVLTWWPDCFKKLFGSAFFTAPYDEAIRKRKMVVSFLQTEVMHELVERFDKTCKKCLQKGWSGNSKVKAFDLIKVYAFALATELFTSIEDLEWEAVMLREFTVLLKGVFDLPIYFPGTRHYKSVKAAEFIRRELIKVIEKKRCRRDSEGFMEKDLISYLIEARDENGDFLSDVEIADNVILLMDSGHDTSSAAMMLVMKFLSENPDCYQLVLQEQKAIAMQKKGGEMLNKDDIHKMKYSWNVVREALRLMPPVQGTFRKAKVDFTYDGYLVPKGWMVWWVAANTHKIADYFPNPDKFDPARFERDNLIPYTFVPFGGGPRMCPGQDFAKVEILVFLHNLVCNFRWELEFPDEIITIDPLATSSKGLPVYLYPLS